MSARGAPAVVLLALTGCASQRVAQPPPAFEIPVLPSPRPHVRAATTPAAGPPAGASSEQTAPRAATAIGVDGCPADTVAIGSFCIDRYEAPNEKGELPYALQTAYDGEAWCAERGKRLCTEDEWVRACSGPRARPFPYGEAYRPGTCNDDHTWQRVRWNLLARWPQDPALSEAERLYQADMSGARAECVSAEGAFDLTGNVAEWVRKSKPSARPGYDHVLKGCFWSGCYKTAQASCGFTNGAHPGTFRTYEAGFRCCTPRAPAVPSGR